MKALFHTMSLVAVMLTVGVVGISGRQTARTLQFPEPPHRDAIGTHVTPPTRSEPTIETFVREVTILESSRIRRGGLDYVEIRGTIEGVGWGGDNGYVRLESHYAYKVPYVLRIPEGWAGTLVIFRHGGSPAVSWKSQERQSGPQNTGRIFHEVADRFISDTALHPVRRWAYFAANFTPFAFGPQFAAFLQPGTDDDNDGRVDEDPGQDDDGDGLEDEDARDNVDNDGDRLVDEDLAVDDDRDGRVNEDPGRAPVNIQVDATLSRDMAVVAQRLLKTLTSRTPSVTLGTGHSGGSNQNMTLNIGIDATRVTGRRLRVGDNHLDAYVTASSKIYDGFLAFGGGGGPSGFPIDPALGVSVPTIFVAGEADNASIAVMRQIREMMDRGLNPSSLARVYMIRNLAHIDSDLVRGLVWGPPEQFARGAGDRLKPITGTLLDALHRWVAHGITPPQSVISGNAADSNADGVVDTLRFPQAGSTTATGFPFVDSSVLDRATGPITSLQNNAALVALWASVQQALSARIDSIFLPETACRRGRFAITVNGPVITQFVPFDRQTLLGMWGSMSAHQTCRVQTVDTLVRGGLYDPTVVTIDIRPDDFPNRIDTRDAGSVPVAIFSTAGFDATVIDAESLRLAGVPRARGDRSEFTDVNGDGRLDLLVHFPQRDLTLNRPDDAVMELEGRTWSGLPFSGTDLVQLVSQ